MKTRLWQIACIGASVVCAALIYSSVTAQHAEMRDRYIIVQLARCQVVHSTVITGSDCLAQARAHTAWIANMGNELGILEAASYVAIGWIVGLASFYLFRRWRNRPALTDR
jgi:hypothetical protein